MHFSPVDYSIGIHVFPHECPDHPRVVPRQKRHHSVLIYQAEDNIYNQVLEDFLDPVHRWQQNRFPDQHTEHPYQNAHPKHFSILMWRQFINTFFHKIPFINERHITPLLSGNKKLAIMWSEAKLSQLFIFRLNAIVSWPSDFATTKLHYNNMLLNYAVKFR